MHILLIVLMVMLGVSLAARGARWGARYGLQMGLHYGGLDETTAARIRRKLARRAARRRDRYAIDRDEESGDSRDEAMARALAERDQQLDDLNRRVLELEERLDFTERLLAGRRAEPALSPPPASPS